MAQTSFFVIASACDRRFGLFIGDFFCDGVHSRLAFESLAQVHMLQRVSRECKGGAQRCGVEKVECKCSLVEVLQLEHPAMPEIWRSLKGPVVSFVIVPGDFNGIVGIAEDREAGIFCVLDVAQTKIREDAHLPNSTRSGAEKAAKEFANPSWHTETKKFQRLF